MRDAIEAAFNESDEPLPTAGEHPAVEDDLALEAQIEVPGDAAAPAAAEGAQDLDAIAEGEQKDENEAVQQQARDEQGKFKGKEEGIQPGPKSGPKGDRAPASWKPDIREHWGALP